MKKLTKIWGIGLTIVLVTSLLLAAAPASASELAWGSEAIPSTTNNIIVNGVKITDMAVAGDGQTIYATVGTTAIYKSTDGGRTWGTKTATVNANLVAVAPDDPDLVVVVQNNLAAGADVSTNGGSSWTNLGTIGTGISNDVAVSPADGSNHYIAIAGAVTAAQNANDADVFYYKLGAIGATWTSLRAANGFGSGTGAAAPLDTSLAVAYSPNFASDKMMLTITYETDRAIAGTPDVAYLEVYSFNYSLWNQDAALTGYPVLIETDTDSTSCTGALSVSPDYLGSDDAMRVAFAGLDFTGGTDTTNDGIYRMKDTSVKAMSDGKDVNSIAYDGTNLIAGSVSSNAVWRSSDPLASSPTVSTTSSLKRLLGTNVVVAWAGAEVVCATQGTFSAFGVSDDNGASFNGVSMVDYGANGFLIRDVAVSADGSVIYLATEDNANAYAVWRKASAWQMVFNKAINPAMPLIRVAPDDADAVYVAEDMNASQTMYFSATGGDTKWFLRTAKANVSDLAVESTDVLYSSNAGNVYRSTNNGFTWGSAKSAGVDTVYSIKSIGEDTLIAGGNAGKVATSSDGGQTWSKPHATKYPFTAGNVMVAATGTADGDFIYCASSVANNNIVRWELGSSTSWSDIINGTVGGTTVATGIELSADGVCYVLVNDPGVQTGFYRSLSPSTAGSTTTWSSQFVATPIAFTILPDALILTEGSTKVWALDAAGTSVQSYADTVATDGPSLAGPADGATININPISGGTYNVPFTWTRLSKATAYQFQAALDSGFVELIVNNTAVASTSGTAFLNVAANTFMPGETYYWRVRLNSTGPVFSPWSEVRTFTVSELPETAAPVIIEQAPAPVISVPPTPEIVLQPPEIVLPAPTPAPEIVIPAAPAPTPAVPSWAIYAIIIIGAVLVIALIVLIMRTRRPV